MIRRFARWLYDVTHPTSTLREMDAQLDRLVAENLAMSAKLSALKLRSKRAARSRNAHKVRSR